MAPPSWRFGRTYLPRHCHRLPGVAMIVSQATLVAAEAEERFV
jgi:hypothetical protein